MSAASILAGVVWGGAVLAGAGDIALGSDVDRTPAAPMILAGEIVISSHPKASDSATTSEKDATRQMEAAREHRTGQASTPAVIVVPEDDEGMLSPRRSGSGAAEHSSRARTYRQIDTSSGVVAPQLMAPDAAPGSKIESSTQRARDNRNRATEYRTGEARIGNQVAVVGKDGLPIIDCSATENVAGRIGDDTRSGSVVILIQDRNQIRVRCR